VIAIIVAGICVAFAQPLGKCGDGICDDFEKAHPDLCPEDCKSQQSTATPATASIIVNYSKELGNFSPYLFGINIKRTGGLELVQAAGFKIIQLLEGDFLELDKLISSIFEHGAEPMVTMPMPPSDRKPSDMDAYVASLKKIATHFKNTKWPNNGKVRLLRFANEPDNAQFWHSSKQDFFETYAAVLKALKSVDPSFILDGPGFMIGVDGQLPGSPCWVSDFLEYMSKNNAPVDLFSTHLYSPVPYSFYENFGILQNELKKYPSLSPIYGTPKLANDEWNIKLGDIWSGSYSKQFDMSWAAAAQMNSLINMIKQGLTLSVPMAGVDIAKFGGHDFLLVDCNGNGKPVYYAYKGLSWLCNTARLSTEGDDHMNFAAIAGKKDNQIVVVLSNYDIKTYMDKYPEIPPPFLPKDSKPPDKIEYDNYVSKFGEPKVYNKYGLTLNNLPWNPSQEIIYERYLVDDNHKLDLVQTKTVKGDKTLSFAGDITAPSVEIIKVYLK